MPKPHTNWRTNEFLKVFGPAAIIAIPGFLVAYQFVDRAPPRHITIATGSPNGASYAYGMAYRSIMQKISQWVLRAVAPGCWLCGY